MSIEDGIETPEGVEPDAQPEAPAAPEPGFTAEDIARIQAESQALREQLAEMRGAVDALKSQPAPQPQVVTGSPEPVITDEEIDEAVSEGKGAGTKFRRLVDQAVQRATQRIQTEQIDPLRSTGIASLKELAAGSIKNNEYYNDYKAEIEKVAAQVPAENLGNPQTWQLIYQNVVGSHATEIANRKVEEALRQQRAGGDNALPTGQHRQTETAPPAPRAKDVGGSDADIALRNKGVDEDELVKRMNIPGVTTWAEYVAMGERLEKENA